MGSRRRPIGHNDRPMKQKQHRSSTVLMAVWIVTKGKGGGRQSGGAGRGGGETHTRNGSFSWEGWLVVRGAETNHATLWHVERRPITASTTRDASITRAASLHVLPPHTCCLHYTCCLHSTCYIHYTCCLHHTCCLQYAGREGVMCDGLWSHLKSYCPCLLLECP